MYIDIFYEQHTYLRPSKSGHEHTYTRQRAMVRFRCDNCSEIFVRQRGKMNPKRLNNNYFHVCSQCDAKRFGQSKRIQKKEMWEMKASSLEDISKL